MSSRYDRREQPLSRRDFVRRLIETSAVATAFLGGGYLLYSDEPVRRKRERIYTFKDYRAGISGAYTEMVIVHGNNPGKMARAAIERLGGMKRFLRPGERVLIKPNAGWDRQPELAATTNPYLVGAVVRLCLEAGAGEVWVTDATINDPLRCFKRTLIGPETEKAGGKVMINREDDFVLTDLKGEVLKVWPVSRFYHQVDRVINMPIVKHHSLSGCTIAMKNWYGVLGGRRNRLHQEIDTSIADLATAIKPTLTIVDAMRVLKRNGPTGGSLSDVSIENTIIAGTDEVALDSYSTGFLDLNAHALPFLEIGEKRGLGTRRWKELNHEEIWV